MITVSSAITQALQKDSRDFNVKLLLNGTTNVAGNIRSFKAMKGSCGGEEFNLGVVYCPYITAVIDYEGHTVDTLEGVELLAQIGVNTGTLENPSYAMIDLGYFTILKPQMQGTLAYITAYGRLSTQFNGLYTDDSEKTLAQHLTAVSTATGIATTVKGDLDLTGTVSGLDGWTYIEVLQIIAGLCGGYVTEDNAGGIVLASPNAYNENDATRNPASIYDAHANEFKTMPTLLKDDSVLSGITCFKSIAVDDESAEKFIYGDGYYSYANEYMTQGLFDDMTANIGGYTYRAGSLEMSHGTPILEPWDAVRYDSKVVPCMSIEIIFDGGIAVNIISQGKTLADETGGFTGVLSQRVARTISIANEASANAEEAIEKAEEAKTIAGDTSQYFWHTQTGTDTGAHITEIPKTQFITDPQHGGGNLLARSNGIAVRDGLDELATFSGTSAQIGKGGTSHSVIDSDGMRIYASDGSTLIANLGYGPAFEGGQTLYKPYYTFGSRESGQGNGSYSLAQGYNVRASGNYSQAMGYEVKALSNYSHAEGENTTASSLNAHAEGGGTTASGQRSHAEGTLSTASGFASHAENQSTTASGSKSHAEGNSCVASGDSSHAQNSYTIANGSNQTALGKYNVADTINAVIIGNGTADDARSNALTVDWNGNVDIASGAKYKINGTNLSASDVGALPIAGGTMTGQLKTSFKTSVAMGSYGSSQSTVEGLVGEVRMSSGCMGSASINTAYTANGVTIPTGWYNFIYTPHRSGGLNGGTDGDNTQYGNLFLLGMNNANGQFLVRVSSSAIAEVMKILTSNDVRVIKQGTITGANGTWRYRAWSDGFAEVWYMGSVTFTNAGTSYQGWYRSTVNVKIADAVRNITGNFADTSTVIVTGAYNGHPYTSGGIKSNGTYFEAQALGMNAIPASTKTEGWSVYISGYKRS